MAVRTPPSHAAATKAPQRRAEQDDPAAAAAAEAASSSSDSDNDDSLSLDALLAFCEGRASLASTAEEPAHGDDNGDESTLLLPRADASSSLDAVAHAVVTPALPYEPSANGSTSAVSRAQAPDTELVSRDESVALPLARIATDDDRLSETNQADVSGSSHHHEQPSEPPSYETDASAKSSTSCSASSPGASCSAPRAHPQDEAQRLREIRLGKRQRQRQRQRDELKYLGLRVSELEHELAQLRDHHDAFATETRAAAERLGGSSTSTLALATGVWHQTASVEREALRTSVMENTRLRAQYECQLQIANGLKRLYEHESSREPLETSPDIGFLPKKPRLTSLSDDATVFASLGQDFDAQYAQLDAIFAAAGLSTYDGELTDEMLLRRDAADGTLYFENLYSKVFPFDVPSIGTVLWQTLTVPQLQSFHGSYTVLKATDDVAHTKVVNTITLPDSDTDVTLVIRIATKRFREHGRSTSVWEGLVEAAGAVSVRLRETGWNMLRPAHALRPGQRGPVTIEQACVRITPEVQAPQLAERTLGVGSLLNVLIGSYHRHMELVHLVADDLLAMQFENISLED